MKDFKNGNMNSRKKANEIVQEVHFDFLNEYLFDLDLIDKFKEQNIVYSFVDG